MLSVPPPPTTRLRARFSSRNTIHVGILGRRTETCIRNATMALFLRISTWNMAISASSPRSSATKQPRYLRYPLPDGLNQAASTSLPDLSFDDRVLPCGFRRSTMEKYIRAAAFELSLSPSLLLLSSDSVSCEFVA